MLSIIRKLIVLLAAVGAVAEAQLSVRVAPLSEVVVDLEQRAPAEVLPLNDSTLAAEVNAVVRAVAADVGATVSAGDLLVELDPTDFSLQLASAEAALASARARRAEAEAKLQRARQLSAEQYVSADELLTRETALAVGEADIRSAEAQVNVARRNLDKCTITAPFDGVVRSRSAQVGAYVTVGSPLLRLTQTDHLELDAELPASAADNLGQADALWFESKGERWPVSLLRLSPVVESERRSRRARFAFSGDAPPAGRSGQVAWRVGRGQLPANLVSRRDGGLGVFLIAEGRAVFTPLLGAEEGRPVAVDLPLETVIVVQGQDRLQDGDEVTVH